MVLSEVPLNMLQEITQITMGWWDLADYEFRIGSRRFGNFDEKRPRGVEGDLVRLYDLISEPGDTILYTYNLKANWEHSIELEAVRDIDPHTLSKTEPLFAHCHGGKRACPPERLNGVADYRSFLNIIEDPTNVNRENTLRSINVDQFDPDAFDASLVNLRLYTMDADFRRTEKDLAARKRKNKLVLLKPKTTVN